MLFNDTRNRWSSWASRSLVHLRRAVGDLLPGLFFKRTTQVDATIGFVCGLLAMVAVLSWTRIDFTWHTLIGSAATILVGNASRFIRERFAAAKSTPT